MTDPTNGKAPPAAAPSPSDQRAARRAAALRENLKKRKAQARGRAQAERTQPDGPDSAQGAPPQEPMKGPPKDPGND